MRKSKKLRNIESVYVREAKARRARQDATIILCAAFIFAVIIWSAAR